MFKELMNRDKTLVYTGEVIVPKDENSDESVDETVPKRTKYVVTGQGKLEAKFY